MGTPSRHVPVEVLQYLTDFSTELDAALAVGGFDPWAARLGIVRPVTALRTTWPVPVSTAGYRKREGDDKMRALFQRFASLTTEEWYDGAWAQARILRDNPFSGFDKEPAAMAVEYQRFPNLMVADFLYRNPVLDLYAVDYPGGKVASTVNMFSSSHLVNVVDETSDTWSNVWTDTAPPNGWSGEIDRTLITALRRHFWELKAPNGQAAGYELAGFLVTTPHADAFLDLVSRPYVPEVIQNQAATENVAAVALENRFRTLTVEVGAELTGTMFDGSSTGDEDKIYAFGRKVSGPTPPPYIVATGPTEEIVYDESDELYKNEGLVGIKRIAEFGVAGLIPHSLVRVDLSA